VENKQSQLYPKSVEQRQRLRDSVCHNLLFRTLEAKQIDQVLDAMWEKHVKKGEYIIRQGKFIFIHSLKSLFFLL
jgi:cAMP-dependent protein kinase regulator